MTLQFRSIVVDVAKLRDYCLSDSHPRGRHKTRVFRSRLGLTADDAEMLRQALLDAAYNRPTEFRPTETDQFGRRFVLDFQMNTASGSATIRSAWIMLVDDDVLRLTRSYLL